MKVKFKGSFFGVEYKVIGTESFEWDDVQKKDCLCLYLDILGWVDKELLEPSDNPDSVQAIDVAVILTNQKDEL